MEREQELIECALQVTRLKTMGAYINMNGMITSVCSSDLDTYIKTFQIKLEQEAKLILLERGTYGQRGSTVERVPTNPLPRE